MAHDYDAVVVGAGHNGLVCAAYLARSGRRVALLEARSSVGGCASSEDVLGARVNICNCDHITFRTTPVMDELGLAGHGLEYLDVEPAQMNMLWGGGPAWPVFHDVERTLDALGDLYPDQVAGYRRYVRDAGPVADLILAAAAEPPSRPGLLRDAARRRGRGLATLLRWSRTSAASVLGRYFDDEAVLAPLLAAGPVVWGMSPRHPGTGLGALASVMRHRAQVGRPRGGSGMLAEALARTYEASGGDLRTASPVRSIDCDRSAVRGVTLADGDRLRAPVVVSACDPHRTFLTWLANPPSGAGPMLERWRATPHDEGYESKLDAVVSALPCYRQVDTGHASRHGYDPLVATMAIAPPVDAIHAGAGMIATGSVMPQPVMLANLPTVLDSTMAPPGRHVFSLEVLFTPYRIHGGWPRSLEPRRWLALYQRLVDDGFRGSVQEWRAMTPDRYEREFHLPNGHATSFAGGPLAALRGRPHELTRYETAVPGLYLTGAATFPGAGIWGASGRNTALMIMRAD